MQDDAYYEFWRKHWITVVYIAAALIMALNVWLWCNRVQTNPERVFWNMVSQNLASSSVTVSGEQDSNGGTLKQTVALQLGEKNITHALVNVGQAGTKITTEVIGTPDADYTRYKSLETAQGKNTNGKLINVWATTKPQLFGQTVLGLGLSLGSVPVPIANAHGAANDKILKQIKNSVMYQIDFKRVAKEHKDGRLLYTYDVKSAPFVYVEILKMIAEEVGIASLKHINPADYRDLQTISMKFTVDVRAQQLKKVSYDGSNYQQHYSSYGVPVDVEIPKKTITLEELQGRFQTASQQ